MDFLDYMQRIVPEFEPDKKSTKSEMWLHADGLINLDKSQEKAIIKQE